MIDSLAGGFLRSFLSAGGRLGAWVAKEEEEEEEGRERMEVGGGTKEVGRRKIEKKYVGECGRLKKIGGGGGGGGSVSVSMCVGG